MRTAADRRPPRHAAIALAAAACLVAAAAATAGGRAAAAGAPSPWVIGYYPWYEVAEVSPASFPYAALTHVAIGDLLVTGSGCCTPAAGAAATWRSYAPAVVRRAHAAGTRVLLQLGGAGNVASGWRRGTATDAAAARLARQIVAFARATGADGVAIDWEQEVDPRGVGRLARQLRHQWPAAILTFEIDPFDSDLSWVPSVAPSLDRIDAMTYVGIGDWGGWDGPWHQGALRGDGPTHPFSVDRTVKAMIAAGLPREKVGIGIGLYGTGYGDTDGDGRCPTGPTGGFEGEAGPAAADFELQLDDVARLYAPHMRAGFDPVARTPFLSAPAPGAGGGPGGRPRLCYITYEDARSAREKGRYVRANGLGAVILWAVPQDRRGDGSYPVVRALDAAFGR